MDGFWLPQDIRQRLVSAQSEYIYRSFASGRPARGDEPGAVTARWPRLDAGQWADLLAALQANRRRVPTGPVFWERLNAALRIASRRLGDTADDLHRLALATLPGYTGYSAAMIRIALGALDLFLWSNSRRLWPSYPPGQPRPDGRSCPDCLGDYISSQNTKACRVSCPGAAG